MRLSLLAPLALFSSITVASTIPHLRQHDSHDNILSVRSAATPAKGPLNPGPATPDLSFDELWDLTNRFWTAFTYPNNVKQTLSINSTIFSKSCLGRVDVSRTFNGRELNTEYIFGLFSALELNPNYFSLLGLPSAYNITHFSANQNVVAVAVIVDFTFPLFGVTSPVEIDVWLTFNSQKQISQYDATFRWLDWQFSWLLGVGEQVLGVNSSTEVIADVTALLAKSICTTADMYCTGNNTQYSGFEQCFNYLTQDIPFGSSFQLGMDTLLCRMVHQNMVPFRPDVHCSHIGPSGGAYCVNDLQYADVVTQRYFKNTPFVPYGYQKDKAIAQM